MPSTAFAARTWHIWEKLHENGRYTGFTEGSLTHDEAKRPNFSADPWMLIADR
jgi:hypothetical protein